MKIQLTESELSEALRSSYPVPAGYAISDVTVQKYSSDFCTIELVRIPPAHPSMAQLAAAETANEALAA